VNACFAQIIGTSEMQAPFLPGSPILPPRPPDIRNLVDVRALKMEGAERRFRSKQGLYNRRCPPGTPTAAGYITNHEQEVSSMLDPWSEPNTNLPHEIGESLLSVPALLLQARWQFTRYEPESQSIVAYIVEFVHVGGLVITARIRLTRENSLASVRGRVAIPSDILLRV